MKNIIARMIWHKNMAKIAVPGVTYQSNAAQMLGWPLQKLTTKKLTKMQNVKSSSTKISMGQSIGIILKGNSMSMNAVGKVGSKSHMSLLSSPIQIKNSLDYIIVIQNEPQRSIDTQRIAEQMGISHFQKCQGCSKVFLVSSSSSSSITIVYGSSLSPRELLLIPTLTFILNFLSLRLCRTQIIAIVVKRMVTANKFHCDMNQNDVSCLFVSVIVKMVIMIRPKEKNKRRPAKKFGDTQGAAFKWSLFNSFA